MKLIVDVQGFKTEFNEFIPKEIAILDNTGLQSFLIKPPFAYYGLTAKEMKQVNWIERNRNIYWKEGFIPFSKYKELLAPLLANKRIYVKGEEKAKWVKDMFGNHDVINLEEYSCPSIKCPNFHALYELYNECNGIYTCVYHKNFCALKNVMCLHKWFNNDQRIFIA